MAAMVSHVHFPFEAKLRGEVSRGARFNCERWRADASPRFIAPEPQNVAAAIDQNGAVKVHGFVMPIFSRLHFRFYFHYVG